MVETGNYYVLLGISPDATLKEIKAARRTLAKKVHPDRGGSNEQAAAVNEAADVLSDPVRRSDYDRRLRLKREAAYQSPPKEAPRYTSQPAQASVIVCPHCGVKNRMRDTQRLGRCGSCGKNFTSQQKDNSDSYGKILTDFSQDFAGKFFKNNLKGVEGNLRKVKGLAEDLLRKAENRLKPQTAPPQPFDQAEERLRDADEWMERLNKRP